MEKENRFNGYHSPDPSLPPSRLSFREAMEMARAQAEYPECYTAQEARQVAEIIPIIAEVYLLAPDKPIRVSGEWLDGYTVQEIFRQIRREHLIMVYDEFSRIRASVANVKAYLRTMLYNSVFTMEAQYTNKAKVYGLEEF